MAYSRILFYSPFAILVRLYGLQKNNNAVTNETQHDQTLFLQNSHQTTIVDLKLSGADNLQRRYGVHMTRDKSDDRQF